MSETSARRRRILLVTPFDESEAPTSGTPQRLELIKRALRTLGEVTVFHTPQDVEPSPDTQPRHLNRTFEASVATAMCMNLKKHKASAVRQKMYAQYKPETYDVIFLHRLAAAWWTGNVDPNRTLLDMDDIISQQFRQGVTKGNRLVRIVKLARFYYTRWTEKRILDCFHRVFVCSEADKTYLNDPHVEVLPNSYWPVPEMDVLPAEKPPGSMLFVGTLSYSPNAQGLQWFVEKVLPRIREQRPDATLTVVGRCPPSFKEQMPWTSAPGVDFKGTVDSVTPYVMDCQFEICPLLTGQGTRIKIVESLAFGKPVVSTTIGAYGLSIQEHEGIIIRDDPEHFAQACLELLDKPNHCHAIGITGRQVVSEKYGPAGIEQMLRKIIEPMPLIKCDSQAAL